MLELGRETAWPAVGEATAAAAGSRAGGEAVGGGGGGGRGDWWGGGGEPEGCRSSAGESLLLVCVFVFEKAREAWKSQSHISAHFAPVEQFINLYNLIN